MKTRRRTCKCCGSVIESYNIWLCDACQGAGMGAEITPGEASQEELLRIARARERADKNPLEGMDIGEIALLARCFMQPYSSYGKLRGYVYACGKLPPKSMERRGR